MPRRIAIPPYALLVYYVVGLAKGHATPHRDHDFSFRPHIFGGLALKPSFLTPNTLSVESILVNMFKNMPDDHWSLDAVGTKS